MLSRLSSDQQRQVQVRQVVVFKAKQVEEFFEIQYVNNNNEIHDTKDLKNFLALKPWTPDGKVTGYRVTIQTYANGKLIQSREETYFTSSRWPPKNNNNDSKKSCVLI